MIQVNSLATHSSAGSLPEIMKQLKRQIVSRGDLPHVTVEQQLEILHDLCSFPLGKFFVERKGADGFWTDYIINYPNAINTDKRLSFVEGFILERCPLTLATRERFKIFQDRTQQLLKHGDHIASIPCGMMRDLLSLDYSKLSSFSILGLDLDENSLVLAKELAKEYSLEKHVKLVQQDAWQMNMEDKLDIINSNGLNVYISDKEKVRDLYRCFFRALKKGGSLIIGVLTYPPGYEKASDWNLVTVPEEDVWMERILFQDVLGSKWRNFRTKTQILKEFKEIGFDKVEIIFDSCHIFPTVIATK